MAQSYANFISIENQSPLADPPAVLNKAPYALPDLPTAYELDTIRQNGMDGRKIGPSIPSTPRPPTPATPASPNDLESSRPPSPGVDAISMLQTLTSPPINKWRVLSCCIMSVGQGLNDAAPGALIPYMEKDYNIGYAIVSLIFVANAVGFISAAPLVHVIQARLGRARSLAVSQATLVVAYIMLVCRPPFPVVVLAFLFLGFGIALSLAMNNTFCASLASNTTILGLFHGSYGVGGTVGPLIATGLVTHGRAWSTFYFLALSIAVANLVSSFFIFRRFEIDTPSPLTTHQQRPLNPTPSHPEGTLPPPPSKASLLKQALRNKTTILGALFIFAYQGAEVSISGWVISFLISYRHSSPTHVGYVTSGFWAGITLGRFCLSHPCHKYVGEKRAVFFLVAGAAAFQLLVWLVPNVIGEAVAVSIVGLLLGPIYPCATAVFSKLIPHSLLIGSLAVISALGSSGGAVAPFFTGLLAQEVGTWVLHPICIALFAGMVGCWSLLPRIAKRDE